MNRIDPRDFGSAELRELVEYRRRIHRTARRFGLAAAALLVAAAIAAGVGHFPIAAVLGLAAFAAVLFAGAILFDR